MSAPDVKPAPTDPGNPRSDTVAAAVNGARLWRRLEEMAEIGAIPGGGVNRPALSAVDIRSRALLIGWARARGFRVAVDAAANLFVVRPGADPDAPPLLTGSHMDSQPKGGRYDGMYGVLAGFEVLEALADAGVATARPVAVVAWTNEEGGRFPPGLMGSTVFAGESVVADWLDILDGDGLRLGDALAETLAATPDAARLPLGFPVHCYVELHIEQGPVLEAAGLPIGIVTGIQASRWYEVTVTGETAHAGTTPRAARRDALKAAIALIARLYAAAEDAEDRLRFTVGRMTVAPGAPNSVPDAVRFTIDCRHPDETALDRVEAEIDAACRAAGEGCAAGWTALVREPAYRFDPGVTAILRAAAEGVPCMDLPSGASHDAGPLAAHCPTGMLFIPCAGGVSHNVAERITPADATAGARVLARAMVASSRPGSRVPGG